MEYTLPTYLYRGSEDIRLCATEADAQEALAQGYVDSPALPVPRRRRVPTPEPPAGDAPQGEQPGLIEG